MLNSQHLRGRGCCPCARVKDNRQCSQCTRRRVSLLCVAAGQQQCGASGLALRLAASAFEQRPSTLHAHPLPPPSPHLSATVLSLQSASFTVNSTPAFIGEL